MSKHKILHCIPGGDLTVKIVDNITSKLQELIGPTRAVECLKILNTDFVIYADMEAFEKKLPANRMVLGRTIYGPLIVAKLQKSESGVSTVGLTEVEQIALNDVLRPVKGTKLNLKSNWDIN